MEWYLMLQMEQIATNSSRKFRVFTHLNRWVWEAQRFGLIGIASAHSVVDLEHSPRHDFYATDQGFG